MAKHLRCSSLYIKVTAHSETVSVGVINLFVANVTLISIVLRVMPTVDRS